ncbi:MAG: choice-of-anchor U domain-containing protein [Thermodesulfobacteriota bacterium]
MKKLILAITLLLLPAAALAGPYPPAAGQNGTTAVYMDDPSLAAWASAWVSYAPGPDVDAQWKKPEEALGKAQGTAFDIVCLGRGGSITLEFGATFKNGPGADLFVFENSFSDNFLELAYVEVSSDGQTFVRFPSRSLIKNPVSAYGTLNPTDVDGLAGKYRQGFGTPFDLQVLASRPEVLSGALNLTRVRYIRLVDVVGDGSSLDSVGQVIYDPYPTKGSAGFDLDAVAVSHPNADAQAPANNPPEAPALLSPGPDAVVDGTAPTLTIGDFFDPDPGDTHLATEWELVNLVPMETLLLKRLAITDLRKFPVPESLLDPDSTYLWRARVLDGSALASAWSEYYTFTTAGPDNDQDHNGVPDSVQELADLNSDGLPDPALRLDTPGGRTLVAVLPMANVTRVAALRPEDPALTGAPLAPYYLATGPCSFRLELADPDQPAQVALYFGAPLPPGNAWYKWAPDTGWQPYPHAALGCARTCLVLTLKDGDSALGDADGVKNGIIVDPGAVVAQAATQAAASQPAGLGGGSGCFIEVIR